jgi:fibronectin type 3 domain-containing protein
MSVRRSVAHVLALAIGIGLLPACGELVDENSTDQALQPAPSNVRATPTSSTRLTVAWDNVPGAIKYYVYRSGAGGPYGYVTTARAPATSVAVAGLSPNTEYCFQLKTDDGAGVSDFSLPGCATTPGAGPAAPASVEATATSSSRITVEWPANASATKYYVYQSIGSGPFDLAGTVTAPEATFLMSGLLASTTYCYAVAAANADGTSAPSTDTGCAKTFVDGLEAYYKLEDTGAYAEDFSGQGRDGLITGGAVYSSDRAPLDNDRQSILVPGATTDGISIPDAAPFWMSGSFSMALWVKIPTASASPVRIAGKRVAGCGAVTWELAQDATNGLHLKGRLGAVSAFGASIPVGVWTHVAFSYRGSDGTLRKYVDGIEVSSGAFTAGSRTSDPLQLGNSGACGGAAVMVDAVEIHSRELTAEQMSTLGTRPPAPANLVATAGCATRVDLAWDAVPGAFKYFVFKGSEAGDQQYVASVRAPTTTFSDGQISPGQQVSWSVRSVQNGIFSVSSNEQVVVTPELPAPPTDVTTTVLGSGRIQVDWEAVSGATKYFVYESVAGGEFAYRITILGSSPPTWRSGALLANTAYSYKLRVEVPCATSDYSAAASATTP